MDAAMVMPRNQPATTLGVVVLCCVRSGFQNLLKSWFKMVLQSRNIIASFKQYLAYA